MMSEEEFVWLADLLAEAGLLDHPKQYPITIGHAPRFPVIDTRVVRLTKAHAKRDRRLAKKRKKRDGVASPRPPVKIYELHHGDYWVAIPRTYAHRRKRALQLLQAVYRKSNT